MFKQKSSLSIDIRELTLEQVRHLSLFPSRYKTTRILQLEQSGNDPTVTWRLQERELPYPLTRQLDEGDVTDLLALYGPAERLRFLGAYVGEKLVGMALWHFEDWNRTIWLWDIRVEEHIQRRGVGTALLERLQQKAHTLQARGIMLETQTTNYSAVQFYLTQGFRLAGLNRYLYANNDLEQGEVALFLFWPCKRSA
jgi:GNAT superfamily N-acetyltransferase